MTHVIHDVPEGFVPDVSTAINCYREGENRDTI
jgi:hypothetical protein